MEGKKTILVILDGWGIGNGSKADVISQVDTPYWDSLLEKYPHSQLSASGEDVGLPAGQMGNSEVGHLNIGAGRVVYQDLVKINKACENGTIFENEELVKAYKYAAENGKKVHLLAWFQKVVPSWFPGWNITIGKIHFMNSLTEFVIL